MLIKLNSKSNSVIYNQRGGIGVINVIFEYTLKFLAFIFQMMIFLYKDVIFPIIIYIGIPVFIIGCIFSIGFSVGIFVLIIGGFIVYKKYMTTLVTVKPADIISKISK